jgi:hypothetical protein
VDPRIDVKVDLRLDLESRPGDPTGGLDLGIDPGPDRCYGPPVDPSMFLRTSLSAKFPR